MGARKDVATAVPCRPTKRFSPRKTFGQSDFTVQGGCTAHKKRACGVVQLNLDWNRGLGLGLGWRILGVCG